MFKDINKILIVLLLVLHQLCSMRQNNNSFMDSFNFLGNAFDCSSMMESMQKYFNNNTQKNSEPKFLYPKFEGEVLPGIQLYIGENQLKNILLYVLDLVVNYFEQNPLFMEFVSEAYKLKIRDVKLHLDNKEFYDMEVDAFTFNDVERRFTESLTISLKKINIRLTAKIYQLAFMDISTDYEELEVIIKEQDLDLILNFPNREQCQNTEQIFKPRVWLRLNNFKIPEENVHITLTNKNNSTINNGVSFALSTFHKEIVEKINGYLKQYLMDNDLDLYQYGIEAYYPDPLILGQTGLFLNTLMASDVIHHTGGLFFSLFGKMYYRPNLDENLNTPDLEQIKELQKSHDRKVLLEEANVLSRSNQFDRREFLDSRAEKFIEFLFDNFYVDDEEPETQIKNTSVSRSFEDTISVAISMNSLKNIIINVLRLVENVYDGKFGTVQLIFEDSSISIDKENQNIYLKELSIKATTVMGMVTFLFSIDLVLKLGELNLQTSELEIFIIDFSFTDKENFFKEKVNKLINNFLNLVNGKYKVLPEIKLEPLILKNAEIMYGDNFIMLFIETNFMKKEILRLI